MADRDKNFYRELILRANTDLGLDKKNELFPDSALLRLIDTLAKLDQGDDNVLSDDPGYNPLSKEEYEELMGNEEIADFFDWAISATERRRADKEAGEDTEEDPVEYAKKYIEKCDKRDDSCDKYDEGEDFDEDEDEGIDSVGDDDNEENDPPSDEKVKNKKSKPSRGEKDSGCISDATQKNIASVLMDLRF